MKAMMVFLMLAACPLAFADIGPGPETPEITVTFTKDGDVYTGPLSVMWRCNEPAIGNDTESGAVGQRIVHLSCQMGVCTNENWFYKFNPCFGADDGHIRYKTADQADYSSTGTLSFGPYGGSLTIDIDTGQVSDVEDMEPEPEPDGCLPALLLPLLGGFVMLRIR
jgi:hypothetical protein